MKVLNKPVEMIVAFEDEKFPRPMKFRFRLEDESLIVVPVDRILTQHELKIAGNRLICYTCQSVIAETERLYELRYEMKTCRWVLYKM